MAGHSTIPELENADWIREELGKIVEKHVANPSPDQDAEYRSPYDEIRDSIGREIGVALASQPAIQRDADKETH